MNLAPARGVAVREFVIDVTARPGRLPAVRRRPGGRGRRGEEGRRDADRRRVADARSTSTGSRTLVPTALEGGAAVRLRVDGRRDAVHERARPGAAQSRQVFWFHRPETLAGWLEEISRHPLAPTLRDRLRVMPALESDRAVAGAGAGDPEPGGVARGGPPAGADPDGDRLGQDVHGGERLPTG